MLCDICQTRDATVIRSAEVNGKKTVLYRCSVCLDDTAPAEVPPEVVKLDRPCEKCRKAEGDVKLTRYVNGRRVATFICQSCASA